MTECYTREEAEAIQGQRFLATRAYAGVKEGTIGCVTGLYGNDRTGYGIEITWEGIPPSSPLDVERGGLTDGFSKGDMEIVFPDGQPAMEPVPEVRI